MLYTGLDIGTGAIKFVRLKKSRDKYTLVDYFCQELSFTPEISQEEKSEIIIQELKKLNQRFNLHKDFLATAMPRHAAIIKTVFLPSDEEQEIRNMVNFEMEKQIPFPIDKAVTDYIIINNADNTTKQENINQTEVHLFAVKEETIMQHLEILRTAGLEPDVVSVTSVALAKTLCGDEQKDTVYAVIDIGDQFSEINLIYKTDLIASRSINLGGMNLSKSIQKEFKMDYLQAQELKKQQGKEVQDIEHIKKEWFKTLAREIKISLDLFKKERNNLELNHILLTGGGSKLKGLKGYLSKNLKMEVEYAELLPDIEHSIPQEDIPLFSVPVGLAFNCISGMSGINLVPREIQQKQNRKKKRKKILAYSGIALILAGFILAISFNKIIRGQIALNKINQKMEEIHPMIKEVKTMKDQMEKLRESIIGSVVSLDILREITVRCPDNVYLTSFSYEKDKLTNIKGRTKSHSDVSKFSIALGKSPYFGRIEIKRSELGNYDKIELVDFEITCYSKNYTRN